MCTALSPAAHIIFKCINGKHLRNSVIRLNKETKFAIADTTSNEDIDIPKFRTCTGKELLSKEVQIYETNLTKRPNY